MDIDLPFYRSWIDEGEIQEVVDTPKSGWLTTGPKTLKFEEAFKNYIGCKHAIGLNSCSAGLLISLALWELESRKNTLTQTTGFESRCLAVLQERGGQLGTAFSRIQI